MRYRVVDGAHLSVDGVSVVGPCEVTWPDPPKELPFWLSIGAVEPAVADEPSGEAVIDEGDPDGRS